MVNQTKSGPIVPISSAHGLVPPSRKVELSCPVLPSDFWTRHKIAEERQTLDMIATIEPTAEGDRANVQNEILGTKGTTERELGESRKTLTQMISLRLPIVATFPILASLPMAELHQSQPLIAPDWTRSLKSGRSYRAPGTWTIGPGKSQVEREAGT